MPPVTRRQVLIGTFVHSQSRTELGFLHNAAVCVDEKGVIVKVEKNYAGNQNQLLQGLGWTEDGVDMLACKPGQFFFPGFIDTHIHAPQYPNVGLFGKTTLLDWLDTYTFPLEASLTDLSRARRVYNAVVKRTLSHGTTTASYFATIDVAATNLLADLCLDLGQRAFVGRVCMDNQKLCPSFYRDESAEVAIQRTKETIQHVRSIDPGFEIVSPILTPRFVPSCTSDVMHQLGKLQREEKLPVQTHISENHGEIALVAGLFPESSSYADVYERHGLLTPRTILAHAIHLSDDAADLISARGSKVSHCPCSNSALTSGAARVRWLWEKQIEVGLGTDVSGGYSPSILEQARQAALVSRHVAMAEGGDGSKLTVEEVLYLATRGGAAVVGLEDKVGGFEVGKQFDAQLIGLRNVDEDEEIDAGNVDVFGWEAWDELMAKWLYGGDDRNTKKVWVKGRLVHARRGA